MLLISHNNIYPGLINFLIHFLLLSSIFRMYRLVYVFIVSFVEPICAVGFGTIALNSGFFQNNEWCFKGYSLTGPCVRKMIQRKDFKTMPVIFEDFAKDHLASYTGKYNHVFLVVIRDSLTEILINCPKKGLNLQKGYNTHKATISM